MGIQRADEMAMLKDKEETENFESGGGGECEFGCS